MDKTNEADLPADHRKSPRGEFEIIRKHVSMAMRGGEKYSTGPWEGGPPFDVELALLPPGKKNFPYHKHTGVWEYYIFLSGKGKFRDENNDWHPIAPGDHFQFTIGQAHQIWNDGADDLVYYVIANNTPVEITEYPDTGKILLSPPRKLGYLTETEYYDKEE